jgi:hypothetical protein
VTAVSFGASGAASFVINSPTQITAVVGAGSTGNVTVTNPSGTGSGPTTITYVAAAPTAASAAVTRVISDYNGYWSSTAASTVLANQPDTRHNMTAFTYNSLIYSTGVNNASLAANGVTPNVMGDFRSLPINAIVGNTSSSSSSNYIALATKVDGNATVGNYLAPGVVGLKVRDVLIDGVKGLDLGTGVTNISTTMMLDFTVSNVVAGAVTDANPDILVTQTASPSGAVDIYAFLDSNGNIVGNPVQANHSAIAAIGTYKLDLFTLQTNSPYATATPIGNGPANGVRDIRMIAFKMTDFGLTTTTAPQVTDFILMPGGDSDPAFIAYNADSFQIPAPVITSQPTSQVVCPNTSGSVTFTVTATGAGPIYQWRKNGIDIPGATSASYTINNVVTADAGAYDVMVSNPAGSVLSNTVYLNAFISLNPSSASVCINSAATISASANGGSITYQWYSNTTNSSTGGSIIPGATSSSYAPPTTPAGVKYYYATAITNGQSCTAVSTSAAAITVNATSVGGTASTSQPICSGSTATISLSGSTGSIQWEESSNGNTWTTVTAGTGGTSSTYTTAILTATTYYRAKVTSGVCADAYSNIITVNVNPPSNAGTASANQVVCAGTPATVSISGFVGAIQWQQSTNGTTGWTAVTTGSGAQTSTYTTGNITTPMWYRAAVTNGVCPVAYSAAIAIATASTTWNGANWTNGVPTSTTAAIITGNFTATANITACTMTVNNNAAVNIPSGFNVNLYGALTVSSGSFTLNNNANLLQQTGAANTGNIIIKRSTVPLMRLDYVMWSSPVSGQNLQAFSPITLADRFYTYTPASNLYTVVASPSTTNFADATGYLIRLPNNHPVTPTLWTGTFTGVPHNGNFNASVTSGAFNAVGNPYPSAISADAFITANSITQALYFWRKTNNTANTSYATYTLAGGTGTLANTGGDPNAMIPDGIVQVGQGFIVKAPASTISFTNSMRLANATSLLFRSVAERHRIWLNLTNTTGVFSQAMISYMTGATSGIDAAIDGPFMDDSATALTSVIEGAHYAIQGRAVPFEASDVVPLGFKTGTAGTFQITLDHTDGLFTDTNQDIYIKDNITNLTHNLLSGPYSFTSGSGSFNNRFEIVYSPMLAVNNPVVGQNDIIAYQQDGQIIIKSATLQMEKVDVIDIRGRIIIDDSIIHGLETALPLDGIADQMLLLRIILENGATITKKIVN